MNSCAKLLQELTAGTHDEVLAALYALDGTQASLDRAQERAAQVVRSFAEIFTPEEHASVALFSGPGRTEIGGNHTDHQHGHVLCGSVDLDMLACAAPNGKEVIRIHSQGYPTLEVELSSLLPRERERNTSAALVRGVAAKAAELGYPMSGFDAYVTSNVLSGSGLSSSAAYEVLVGNILNHFCCGGALDPIQIAKIGQYAENVYFGKPCGLMDQMASSVGNIITIDFASPAKPVVEPVAVDFSKAGLALCILDSGADHADLTDEYAAIPAECRAVAAVCGGEVLRDVPFETFLAKLPECRRQCGDRAVLRAFHVYADNDRVAKQVAALHDGDFDTFLCLVNESGRSSWEYLQNVIPAGYKEHQEVGVTIAAAKHLLGDKGAVRVHGGGFAGTVQAFVPVEMLDEFKAGMEAILGEGRCHVLSIRPEGGAVL